MSADRGLAWQLADIAPAIDGELVGVDVQVQGVSTDTRSLSEGDLFVALQGPNFDGHAFVDQAEQSGAVALLVSRRVENALPQLLVADTRLALGELALAWRQKFTLPLVAVTGSNGKTTVKEMIAAILQQSGGPVLVTRGNLNNDIGMPLTLLQLRAGHRFAVIEMGANHPGEIDYLTHLARPSVALITNAAPAHLEGFGSLEGVARAKGEIYSGLGEDGVAIINADDRFASLWHQCAHGRDIRTFAIARDADFCARDIRSGEQGETIFELHTPGGDRSISLPLFGEHNVMNATVAAAAAMAMGAGLEAVAAGLASMRAVSGRLQRCRGLHGSIVIDDTYNANPASARAALNVLSASEGERFLVLGDMGELGDDADDLHAELGEQAAGTGIEYLYTVGRHAAQAARAFGEGGRAFESHQSLINALKRQLGQRLPQTVLVKGSRSMHMETVVEALVEDDYDSAAVGRSGKGAGRGGRMPSKQQALRE